MEEQQNQNSEVQVAPAENVESTTTQENQSQASPVETRQDRNWKAMERKQKELERDLKLQKEMNEKLMQLATQNTPKVEEKDELDSIADDEYLSKGKVKQLVAKQAAKIAQEIAQQESEKLIKQQEQAQFMNRLKSQYPDWSEVVNSDTLALLEEQKPELANMIADLKDPYKIGVQSYEYIKALGLSPNSQTSRRAQEVEKKLADNAKTVQTPQAFDKRPIAQAYRITEDEKKKLYQEMYQYGSLAGSVPELR